MNSKDNFSIQDFDTICEFIRDNPFGMLLSCTTHLEINATHLPFQLEDCSDEIVVYAHISKFNSHSNLIQDGKQATIVFQGPNAYVSSSVYGHENVPTWNYQSVHLFGNIEFLNDEQLDYHLRELITLNEKNRENPLRYEDLNADLINEYKKDILGFRLIAYKSEAIFKLSQNRNTEDYKSIITDLKKRRDSQRLAEAMERLKEI